MKKLLLSSLLLVTAINAEEVARTVSEDTNKTITESKVEKPTSTPLTTKESGFYLGAGTTVLNFGGSVEVDDGYRTTSIDKDTEEKPFILKLGYLSESENRVELYYKKGSIDTTNNLNISREFDISLFGINYQWGISSLSSDKVLPYIRLGMGFGSGTANYTTHDFVAVEVDLALGVYYKVTPKFDLSAGVYRRAIVLADDNTNGTTDEIISTALNGIEFGATYHF